jgi:coatomer protein complex subunit gamma
LSAQILYVLGELGPTTRNPGKYIRFIYNRVILENAQVRAAAASSLGKFAAKVPSLRVSVEGLLRRCLSDEDDEVRDRATIALALLKRESPVSTSLLIGQLDVRPERLLRSLEAYKMRPSAGPLTKNDLPDAGGPEEEPTRRDAVGKLVPGTGPAAGPSGGVQGVAAAVPEGPSYAEQLYKIPEFATLGTMFKSSPIEELTQPESEYLVRLVKHVFPEHVVLQFNLTNTVEYQLLTEVEVEVAEVDTENWEMESCITVPKLAYNQTTPFYVCLRSIGEERDGSFECLLKFRVHELDPSSNEVEDDDEGFEEEFALDSTVELSAADFVKKNTVADFRGAWDTLGKEAEVAAIFQLPARIKTVDVGVAAVIDALQMQPCEGTAAVAASAAEHIILLAGVFIGEESVLVRTKLVIKDGGVVLKIAVRAQQAATSNAVLGCIGNIV